MLENRSIVPTEDAAVLNKYAMWNPKARDSGIFCDPCNHCSPQEDVKKKTLQQLRGECHCHPCGAGPDD